MKSVLILDKITTLLTQHELFIQYIAQEARIDPDRILQLRNKAVTESQRMNLQDRDDI